MLRDKLKFCSWNIHGYNSRDLGNKFSVEEFLNIFNEIDFVGITETHIHDEILENMNIPGFKRLSVKNRRKKLKSHTASGGIAVFVKEDLCKLFTVVNIENEDAIWVKIKKETSGEEGDIFIATCYFSPSKVTPRNC